jgi:imidazoleglycerol-phosphate dehydratase / histidinol-phosphatase
MREKIIFLDRDGTLIKEPPSKQIDRIDQVELLPGVIPALLQLRQAGYLFIMISNQDGLGTETYPNENFLKVQDFILNLFRSQGIDFKSIYICPHLEHERCACRKPRTGLLLPHFLDESIAKTECYVIGDRNSDLELAKNLGITGFLVQQNSLTDWQRVTDLILNRPRSAHIKRTTKETHIDCFLDLENDSESEIDTGILFFNHMLEQFAKHAGCFIRLNATGDLLVDDHHLIEDCGIVLGQAFHKALGDKWGIARYGFVLPMDESLALIAVDFSGRACLEFNAQFKRQAIKDLSTEMVKHFFYSFSQNLQATLHIKCEGENTHHMIEAIFKGVGRTFKQALKKIDQGLPSTKGVL